MRILPLLAPILLLCSCVTEPEGDGRPDEEDTDWRTGGKGDGETCDFDQMSAETYYGQLAYTSIQHAGSTRTWYRIGLTWDVKATLDNGNKVDLDVYFLDNNRVVVEYEEEKALGGSQSEVLNQTVLVTRATIDPATRSISIAGLGSGTPITVRNGSGCAAGIAFKFSSDLRSPGLSGDSTVIQGGLTTGFLIDPDHLDQVPNATARKWFEEDVASGKIIVIRK